MLALDAELTFNGSTYRLGEPLDVSEAYTVFATQNLSLDRPEALMLFHDIDEVDPKEIRRLASLRAKLTHLALPRVYSLGTAKGGSSVQLGVAYEHVSGLPLSELLSSGKLPSPLRLYRLALAALEACAEAHSLGLCLGPIAPEQVVVQAHQGDDLLRLHTYAVSPLGQLLGRDRVGPLLASSPNAVPPEHYLGGEHDHRADLYSIAAWMYEALAGDPPFHGDAPELMRAHRKGAEAAPFPPWSRVPSDLAAVVMKALEVSPTERFQSAEEMLEALRSVDFEALVRTGTVAERAKLGAARTDSALIEAPALPPETEATPEVWVFTDGPEFRQAGLTGALTSLEDEVILRRLDAAQRAELLEPVSTGERPAPWAVVFGDMHVLLDDALLHELTLHSGVARVLVSTHLNAELLHDTVASVGLDAHLLAGDSAEQLSESCRAAVSRARRMRARLGRPSAAAPSSQRRAPAAPPPRPRPPLSAEDLGLDTDTPAPLRLGVLS